MFAACLQAGNNLREENEQQGPETWQCRVGVCYQQRCPVLPDVLLIVLK